MHGFSGETSGGNGGTIVSGSGGGSVSTSYPVLDSTSGTITSTSNTLQYWQPAYGYWWYPYQTVYLTPPEPQTCIGKAHVFECDHVPTCKCGAVERRLRVIPADRRKVIRKG